MTNRDRKVNIDDLTSAQAGELSVQIGEKIKEITENAVEHANRILNIYGMHAKMQIVIYSPDLQAQPESSKPAKKTRKPKKK